MPEIQRDDVIHVGPNDYAFGDTPLILRVTAVGPWIGQPGVWREVEGVELTASGQPYLNAFGETQTRVATVRLDRVCWRSEHC